MGRINLCSCSTAILLLGFSSCTPKETQVLLEPSHALGTVLAEETVRAAGTKKRITIISPDVNWGPASTVEEAFRVALKKQGVSVVATKTANLGDPMRSGPVGLKSVDFFDAMKSAVGAGAVVSFVGAPLLAPGEEARLNPDHPPVLVVATTMLGSVPGVATPRMQLARMLDAGTIQVAFIDGTEPTGQAADKTDAAHELFAKHYRQLRRP